MGDEELKTLWAKACIGDIAIYVNGRAFKPSEWERVGKPIIRIQNLNKPTAEYNYSSLLHELKYSVDKGDLLFAWSASLGAYIWSGENAWLNQHIFKVIPLNGIDKLFVYYLLQYLTEQMYAKSHGSGMVHITKGKFESTKIGLPPTKEQYRIVAKIEELFSEIDKGVESLKTAKAQLQVYRQALLKHAFEGKLTAQWRSNNPDKVVPAEELLRSIEQSREERYQQQLTDWQTAVEKWEFNGKEGKKPSKPSKPSVIKPLDSHELEILSQLPQGWAWFLLGDVSDISGGLTKNSKKNELHTTRPYLRVANVYANKLKLDEVHEIGVSESEINRVLLIKDDLLIVEGNGSIEHVGRVAKWDGSIMGCVHQNHLIKARVYKRVVNPDFLLHFLLSKVGRDSIMREASSTSGLHTLSLFKVGNLKVPMCSFDEAFEIVRLLEEKLSFIENAATSVDLEIQRSFSLKQSILKKAFSGQLVPQDPTDETASELLKRIQSEKADRETATKTTKKTKK